MIVELQMTASVFIAAVQNEFRSRVVCFTREFNVATGTLLLDHFDIVDGGTSLERSARTVQVVGKDGIHSINGSDVLLSQEITLHLVTIEALQLANGAPSPSTLVLPVKVRFTLALTLVGGLPQLTFQYRAPADAGSITALVPDAGAQIDAALASLTGTVPVAMSGLEQFLFAPGQPLFTNAGITVSEGLVTVRLENGTDVHTPAQWSSFYLGTVPGRLAGRDWALFVDHRLLLPVALGLMSKAAGNLHDASSPQATWTGQGIHATQSGTLIDAGPLDADVDVTMNVDSHFSVPLEGELQLDLTLGASGDVGGIVGVVMDILGMSQDVSATLPEIGNWQKTGDSSYRHRAPARLRNNVLGTFIPQAIVPDANGLSVVGRVLQSPRVRSASAATSAHPMRWQLMGSCAKGWGMACAGSIELRNEGTAPLEVCDARVLFDPDGQFPLIVERSKDQADDYVAKVSVAATQLQPAYAQRDNPYPCLLLVKSNGGARLVNLGTATTMTAQELERLEKQRDMLRKLCEKLVKYFPEDWLDPQWDHHGPRPEEGVRYLRQALVSGLQPGETVAFIDRKGSILGAGEASSEGVAYLRAVSTGEPAAAGSRMVRSVHFNRSRAVKSATLEPARVKIRQRVLRPVSTIHLHESVNIVAARYQGRRVALALGRSAAFLYGLDIPSRPALLSEFPLADIGNIGVSLDASDAPDEFENIRHGPTRMNVPGVLIGDAFLQASGTEIRVYAPTERIRS